MTTQKATRPPLETHVRMPRGGVAPRCQATSKRTQRQCGRAAREGYKVCPMHGAGTRAREEKGDRRKSGRPVTHARYSMTATTSIDELMAEVAGLEDILTNSDRDLIALKATLVYFLGQLEAYAPQADLLDNELARLEAEAEGLDPKAVTPSEALRFVGSMAALRRPVARLSTLIRQITDIAAKDVAAHQVRAATNAKLAEAKGTEAALELVGVSRSVWHALAGDDQNLRDTYDDALRRRVCAPRHLELPPLAVLEYPVELSEVAMFQGASR